MTHGKSMKINLAKQSRQAQIGRVVLRRLRPQAFPSPEGRIFFSVFAQTIRDLPAEDAKRYLHGDLIHLELAGIDVDWARRIIDKSGLEI